MEMNRPLRLLPTLPMIVDDLTRSGWSCQLHCARPDRSYRGIRLYHGQQELHEDVLYLLHPEEDRFPVDDYAFLSTVPRSGRADRLICPGHSDAEIMDGVQEVFSRFREWEDAIELLVYRGSGLQELCELGAELLENPVCIHDDWFIMVAMSAATAQVMPPEYVASYHKGFVPRIIVDDFRYDSDYLETYQYRDAQLWSDARSGYSSLYVNLWDGELYRGRLLVLQTNRSFRPADFLVAQVLTQRAMLLLRRKEPGGSEQLQSMDDVVSRLIRGEQLDGADLAQLLNMLRWDRSDSFLCIRIRSQQADTDTVTEHVLHSDLFRVFPEGYIMFAGHEQWVILNLAREKCSLPAIRSRLAPLCRDYCLYAGMSSPVADIRDLSLAHHQAKVALDRAFRLRGEKWIVLFSECALEYAMEHLDSAMPPLALVAPDLLAIRELDREKGTQYFQTLKTWLLQERDIPRTAEKLIIHRTTLLYRLKKLRPMLSIDPEDPWNRLYLMLSLWILEQEERK